MALPGKDSSEPGSLPVSSDSKPKASKQTSSKAWFATPAPIRRLFANFPLQTLPANELPATHNSSQTRSCASGSSKPTLFVFTSPEDARHGAPSFNPSCLKWQTWLRLRGVEVHTVASSNHASPSGSLPFLIPAQDTSETRSKPVAAGKLYNWALEHGRGREKELSSMGNMREDAYMSLIEHRIRAAWLHTLYLTPNFHNIIYPLYISSSSSMLPVRATLASELRTAARRSLHLLSPRTSLAPDSYLSAMYNMIHEDTSDTEATILYKSSTDAFAALSTLLGNDEWFFGAKEPGLVDVSLFAYTHLLLDDELGGGWADTRVRRGLVECNNLVRHRKRLYKRCYV